MPSFKGLFRYTIDNKGRVNIPSKIRKSMDPSSNETFVITKGLDGCLFVFPLNEWDKIEEKFRELSLTQKDHRFFIRSLYSHAYEVQCDRQGRIAIPSQLTILAKIEKEVIVTGIFNRIEIWNPTVYDEYLETTDETYESIAEKIVL